MTPDSQDGIPPEVLLSKGLGKLGLFTDTALALLIRYIEEIELFNPAYGLVKVRDRRELVVRHILDSLAPLSIIRANIDGDSAGGTCAEGKKITVADAGSGAGLPGIPLAVCMPDADFTLIERMGRRAGFLRNTLAVLGLSNVRVLEAEMEKARGACQDRFDVIVFRAFRPLEPRILKGLFRLLAPSGTLAAYKGRRQSVEEEIAGVLAAAEKGSGPRIGGWEICPLDVPFLDEERHLLLLRP